MKGFETGAKHSYRYAHASKKECPAMKGFETLRLVLWLRAKKMVRRNAPL